MINQLRQEANDLIKSDSRYLICFIGASLTRLMVQLGTIFVMLWISSFVRTGEIASEEAAKKYYMNTMTIAIIIGIVLLPGGGKISDITPAYVFIPVTFFLKSLIAVQFQFVDTPLSAYARTLCITLSLFAGLQSLGIESLF